MVRSWQYLVLGSWEGQPSCTAPASGSGGEWPAHHVLLGVCYTWLYGHGCTLTTSAVLFASLESSLALFLHGAVLNTSVTPICTAVHQFISWSLDIFRRTRSAFLWCSTVLVFKWVFSLIRDIWFGGTWKKLCGFSVSDFVQFSCNSTTMLSYLKSEKIKRKTEMEMKFSSLSLSVSTKVDDEKIFPFIASRRQRWGRSPSWARDTFNYRRFHYDFS